MFIATILDDRIVLWEAIHVNHWRIKVNLSELTTLHQYYVPQINELWKHVRESLSKAKSSLSDMLPRGEWRMMLFRKQIQLQRQATTNGIMTKNGKSKQQDYFRVW